MTAATAASAQDAREFRSSRPGDFDYYLLALSWSPTFCAAEGEEKEREQCAPGRRLGFVVHGLWPQREGVRLEHCETFVRPPSRLALEEAEGVFPSLGLARHQWRKHGTCTGRSPAEYFADVRRAAEKVRVPEALIGTNAPRRAAPIEIARAFVAANPGLRPDMMQITCRRGQLQEVRICLERDLRGFRSCPALAGTRCPIDAVAIPAPG